MGEGSGNKTLVIIIVIALLGIFYFWYTGGGLGGISLGRPSYQPLGGIAPMAAPEAKEKGGGAATGLGGIASFWPILLIFPASKILSGSFSPLNLVRKSSLKLEPATASIKPNERKTLTATLKFGGGSPWKRKIRFRIEQAPQGGHDLGATLSHAEKRTDGHGQATTEIKAGEGEGTLKVTAEYKSIQAESEITISSRAQEPAPRPEPPIPVPRPIVEGYGLEVKTEPNVVDYMRAGDEISVSARVVKDNAPVPAEIMLESKSKGSGTYRDRGKKQLQPTADGWKEFSFPVARGHQTITIKAKVGKNRVAPHRFSLIGIREDAKELKELLASARIKVLESELKDDSAIITARQKDADRIRAMFSGKFDTEVTAHKKKNLAKIKILYGKGRYMQLFRLLAQCKPAG